MTDLDDLNDKGVNVLFTKVRKLFETADQQLEADSKRVVLEFVIPVLDELDGDDTFATEGWREQVGA